MVTNLVMKYPLILLLFIILTSQKCQDKQEQDTSSGELADCIDPEKIRKDMACTMIYQPVCGCNGVTYSNACVAGNNGLLSWTEGECDSPEEGVSI